MNTRKYMFKNSLVACFACCCISFASAGNPPFFPTDVVTNAKGELLMTDKGVKRVDVFRLMVKHCCVLFLWTKRLRASSWMATRRM